MLVTPSLHELLIGEGLDSMEGLLTNLEGFWLVAAVLGEEEGSLEGFGMLAEVVGVNLRVKFGTRVSRKTTTEKVFQPGGLVWHRGIQQTALGQAAAPEKASVAPITHNFRFALESIEINFYLDMDI